MVLAAIVAALVVPVGFALSLSSNSSRASVSVRGAVPAESVATTLPVLVVADPADKPLFDDVADAATLFLVGTMLFGIAMVVRRSA